MSQTDSLQPPPEIEGTDSHTGDRTHWDAAVCLRCLSQSHFNHTPPNIVPTWLQCFLHPHHHLTCTHPVGGLHLHIQAHINNPIGDKASSSFSCLASHASFLVVTYVLTCMSACTLLLLQLRSAHLPTGLRLQTLQLRPHPHLKPNHLSPAPPAH